MLKQKCWKKNVEKIEKKKKSKSKKKSEKSKKSEKIERKKLEKKLENNQLYLFISISDISPIFDESWKKKEEDRKYVL